MALSQSTIPEPALPQSDIVPVIEPRRGTIEFDDTLQAVVYTAEVGDEGMVDDFLMFADDTDGNSNLIDSTVQIDHNAAVVTATSDVMLNGHALLPTGIVSFVQEKQDSDKKEYEIVIYVDQPGEQHR